MLEEFKPEITEMMMEDTEDWLIDQEEAKAAASNRMIEERDLRASSAPNSLRSPSNYPPIGMFTVSSPTPRSPANPPKRPQ
jgi:histone deacetylase 6